MITVGANLIIWGSASDMGPNGHTVSFRSHPKKVKAMPCDGSLKFTIGSYISQLILITPKARSKYMSACHIAVGVRAVNDTSGILYDKL